MLVNVGKLMSHTSVKVGGQVKHPFNPSLVDAWFMSGLLNNDRPIEIVGVKKNKLQLKNFAFTSESGFGDGNYKGALVFDGVDDYGICNNLPILTDYTVICRRVIEEDMPAGSVASKSTVINNGAFIFELFHGHNTTLSFGGQIDVDINYNNSVSWQTKKSYNGEKNLRVGSGSDTDTLTLGTIREKDYRFLKGAIYYFALYDKSLTLEEIEEEKVKLENEWIKRINEPIISFVTLNQNLTDPATMLSGDINGLAIRLIRQNSHRVLGKYTASGKMAYCRLKDDDGTKYHDGTTADLTGAEGDVFVKLPQFYWKVMSESADVFKISLAYGGNPGEGWHEWDGNILIGTYEAYNSSSKLYSRSGVTPTVNVSQANFKAYARSRGTGYRIVDWEMHCVMAMLYYCQYGHMNCQSKIGAGTSSYPKVAGGTNALGMTDTVAGGNGDSGSINFWGLENWWGDLYEWVDNIVFNSDVATITNPDGSTRTVQAYDITGYYPKKMVIGEHFDLIGKEQGASDTTGYCDYYYLSISYTSRVVRRSGYSSGTGGGVAFSNARSAASSSGTSIGSRLAFIGDLVETESVSAFKAIAVTN